MICRSCRAVLRGIPRATSRLTTTNSTPLRTASALTQTTSLTRTSFFSTTIPRAAGTTPSAPSPEALSMTPAENDIAKLLETALTPTHVLVKDVSGGCGSMYAIEITSEMFRGQSMLKQQRMVNKALEGVVGSWHGVQIRTSVPESS